MADKRRKKGASRTKSMRNMLMLKDAASGMSNKEIAAKYGISYQAASEILNHSKEAKDLHTKIKEGFEELAPDAMKAIRRVVNDEDPDAHPSALKAALSIIDRVAGKVPDKLHHTKVGELENMSDEELREYARKHLERDDA